MGYRDHEDALRARTEALKTRLQGLDQDAEATRAELAQAESELAALESDKTEESSRLLVGGSIAATILCLVELQAVFGFGLTLRWFQFICVVEAFCLGLVAASFYYLRRLVAPRLVAAAGILYAITMINVTAFAVTVANPPAEGVFIFWGPISIVLYLALLVVTALAVWHARHLSRRLRLSVAAIQGVAALVFALRHWLVRSDYIGMYTMHRFSEFCDALAFFGLAAFFWYSRVSPPDTDPADENASSSETAQ